MSLILQLFLLSSFTEHSKEGQISSELRPLIPEWKHRITVKIKNEDLCIISSELEDEAELEVEVKVGLQVEVEVEDDDEVAALFTVVVEVEVEVEVGGVVELKVEINILDRILFTADITKGNTRSRSDNIELS